MDRINSSNNDTNSTNQQPRSSSTSSPPASPSTAIRKGGGVMMTGAFPDLHYKMCKKIAQLTKVIYHLNTKNEDHQMDLEAVNTNHQNEIAQTLKDASSKINHFKEQLETKKIALNADVKLKQFMKKHEEEKRQAKVNLEQLQQQAQQSIESLKSAHQSELVELKKDVLASKRNYEEKLKELGDASTQLRAAYERKREGLEATHQAKKVKLSQEVEEVVKRSNDQYNQMMLEQLSVQDSLRQEMASMKIQAEKNQRESLEQQLNQLRTQLSAEKEKQLSQQKQEFERTRRQMIEDQDEERVEWTSKVERIVREAERFQREKREMEKKSTKLEQVVMEKQTALVKAEQESSALRSEVQTFERQTNEVKSCLAQTQKEHEDAKRLIKELEAQVEQQKELLMNRSTSNGSLQIMLQEALDKYENFRTIRGLEVAKKEEELRRKTSELEKIKRQHHDTIVTLEHQATDFQKQLVTLQAKDEDEKARLVNDGQVLGELMTRNQVQYIKDKEIWASKMSTLEETIKGLKSDIEACKAQMVQERKDFENSLHQRNEEWASKLQTAQADWRKQLATHDEETKHIVDEKVDEFHRLVCVQKELRQQLADTEASLLTSQEEKEVFVSKMEENEKTVTARVLVFREKADRLQEEVRALKMKVERLGNDIGVKEGKAKQLEAANSTLRKEMIWMVEQEKACAGEALATLRQECSEKLEQQIKEMEDIKQMMQREQEAIVSSMMSTHAEALHTMQESLEGEQARVALLEKERLASRLAGESTCESLRDKHEDEVKASIEKHAAHILTMRTEQDQSMMEERERHQAQLDRDLERLRKDHQIEVDRLQSVTTQQESEFIRKLDLRERELEYRWSERQSKELKAQEERLSCSAEEARKKVAQALEASKATVMKELQKEKLHVKEGKDRISDLTRQLQEAEVQSKERQRRFQEYLNGIQSNHQQTERHLRSSHEQKLREAEARYLQSMKETKEDHDSAVRHLEQAVRDMECTYEEEHQRYLNRESRAEDLVTIDQLEASLAQSEMMRKHAMDEMAYFKLELVNREESYNKIFSRSPNVGIMQAVKVKQQATPAVGSPMMAGGGGGHSIDHHHKRRNTMPVSSIATSSSSSTAASTKHPPSHAKPSSSSKIYIPY